MSTRLKLEASKPKWVSPNDINIGLTHLDSEASNYPQDIQLDNKYNKICV